MKKFATTIVMAVSAVGCRSNAGDQIDLIMAIDVSDRSPGKLLAYTNLAFAVQSRLQSGDTLHVFTFANAADPIYLGSKVVGRSNFNRVIASKLEADRPGLHAPGTRSDVMVARMVAEARGSDRSAAILVLTDGGVEDQTPPTLTRIRTAIKSACATTFLRHFVVAGVDQQWRDQWSTWLAPMGRRANVRGLGDAREPILKLVEETRGEAKQ